MYVFVPNIHRKLNFENDFFQLCGERWVGGAVPVEAPYTTSSHTKYKGELPLFSRTKEVDTLFTYMFYEFPLKPVLLKEEVTGLTYQRSRKSDYRKCIVVGSNVATIFHHTQQSNHYSVAGSVKLNTGILRSRVPVICPSRL